MRLALFSVSASCLLGCASKDLVTVASSLVQTQRESDLTRSDLSGSWDGVITALDGVGSQAIVLVFVQKAGFSLAGSLLIGEDIRLGGGVSRDTFALVNAVFTEDLIRFNLAGIDDNRIILAEGNPVLFSGSLSENSFMSGDLEAGSKMLGLWQARATTASGL